mmetsp:Transcript_14832/g.19837  ORF Transcript_14832/g.19837 Transcript_14832/m.19837 type:complete len:1301 (-) Transcript_14832:417-4319(-)
MISLGPQRKKSIESSEAQDMIVPMHPDVSIRRNSKCIAGGYGKDLDVQDDTKILSSVSHYSDQSQQRNLTEPFPATYSLPKIEVKEFHPMNNKTILEKMWSFTAEPPSGYSSLRMYTPPLLPSIPPRKLLSQIVNIATAEKKVASKSCSIDNNNEPVGSIIWGSCLDVCANVGHFIFTASRSKSSSQTLLQSSSSLSNSSHEDKKRYIIDPNIVICPYQLAGTCADIHCPYQHLAPSCGDNVVFGWKEKPVLSFKDDNNVIHESFGLLQLNNNRRIAPLLPELRLSLPPIFPNNSREAVVGCTDYGGEESSQKRDANRIQRKQWQRGIHASATALEDKHASNMKLPEKISGDFDSKSGKKRKRYQHESGANVSPKIEINGYDSVCNAKKNDYTKPNKMTPERNSVTESHDIGAKMSSSWGGPANNTRGNITEGCWEQAEPLSSVFPSSISSPHGSDAIDDSLSSQKTNNMKTNISSKIEFGTPEGNDNEFDNEWIDESDYIALPVLSTSKDTGDVGFFHESKNDYVDGTRKGGDGDISTKSSFHAMTDKAPFWWWDDSDSLRYFTLYQSEQNASLTAWLSAAGFTVRRHDADAGYCGKLMKSSDGGTAEHSFLKNKIALGEENARWNDVSIGSLEYAFPFRLNRSNDDISAMLSFDQHLVRYTARILDCARICMHAGHHDVCNAVVLIYEEYISNDVSEYAVTTEVNILLCDLIGCVRKLVAIANCSKNVFDTFKCQMSLALLAEWIFAFNCDYLDEHQNDNGNAMRKGGFNEDEPPVLSRKEEMFFWSSLLRNCLYISEGNNRGNTLLAPLYSLIESRKYASSHASNEQFNDQWYKVFGPTIRSCLSQITGDDSTRAANQFQHLLNCVLIGQELAEGILSRLQGAGRISPYTILHMILEPMWIEVIHHVRSLKHKKQSFRYLESIVLALMNPLIFSSLSYIVSSFSKELSMVISIEGGENDTLYRLNSRAHAAIVAVDTFLHRILKTVYQLGDNVASKTKSDLLLAPLCAISVSVAVLLGLYDVAQERLERALSVSPLSARPKVEGGDSEKTSFCHLFEGCGLSVYSELLWSQLIQLRISFPAEDDGRQKHDIVKMIFNYGIHLHNLSLQGDKELVRCAGYNISASTKNERLSHKLEPNQIATKKSSQIFERAREACFAVTSLISLPDQLLDNVFELIKKDGDVLLDLRQYVSQKKESNTKDKSNFCSLVLDDVPMSRKMEGQLAITQSLFPLSVFLLGNTLTHLSLVRCQLYSMPQSFGVWLSNLEVCCLVFFFVSDQRKVGVQRKILFNESDMYSRM